METETLGPAAVMKSSGLNTRPRAPTPMIFRGGGVALGEVIAQLLGFGDGGQRYGEGYD